MARGRFVNRPYDIVMTFITAIYHLIKTQTRPEKFSGRVHYFKIGSHPEHAP